MRILVIKSSEWLRASGSDDKHAGVGVLHDGLRFSCLGLDARDWSVRSEEMIGIEKVSDLHRLRPGDGTEGSEPAPNLQNAPWALEWQLATDGLSLDARECMRVNDDPTTTDDEKIAALQPILGRNGIRIVWRPDL